MSMTEDEVYLEPDHSKLTSTSPPPSSLSITTTAFASQVKAALEKFKSSDPTFEKCIISNNNSYGAAVGIGLYKCSIRGILMDSKGMMEFHERWNHSGSG
jgi:hypothetical protein